MEPDDFFNVTDRDVRTMLRDLHKITEREFRFKDKEVEKEFSENTVLRIRLIPRYLLLHHRKNYESS